MHCTQFLHFSLCNAAASTGGSRAPTVHRGFKNPCDLVAVADCCVSLEMSVHPLMKELLRH